jgi:hypothetical protein
VKEICPATRYWIQSAAAGAFSFRYDGERLTTARGVTFCASTFVSMMARGWVEEL